MTVMKIDALQKWQNELLADLSPAVIGFLKHSYRTGRLLDIDRLYSTMFHDWDVLQKDCCDMEEAVRSLEWSVMPKCKAGEEPDALAQEVAQVVEEALWRRSTGYEARAYSHTFPELVGALVHALFRGYNVHEIVWENDGELIFPARYVQLPAQFLAWEDKAGRPDRLLLVRDGMGEEPVPFPAWKFIVALNTTGPDHPIFNAAYFSLVKWFTAFKFGLGWYMEYCQKYGIPTKVIEYGSEEEKQKIIASMQDERVLNTVFVQEGRKYEMGHAPASGASLPQRDLVQLAEAACHKLILGQTLTSDTSAHGGSLAQARVHAGVQADVVKKRAEYVAEVLNAQLVPAIVLANFGRLEGMPLPELRCKLPEAVANTQKAQFWQAVLAIPGMRVKQSEVYESLGVAAPGEGDEVFGGTGDERSTDGKAAGPSSPDARTASGYAEATPLRSSGESVHGARAEAESKQDAAQVWLEPLRRELQEARRKGSTLADIRAGLAKWRPDTRALADVFAENAEQGFFGVQEELQPDDVAAANPYGCNQYGEGWRQPHNGLGSKPGKPVKKGDKKENDKKEEEKKKAAFVPAKSVKEAEEYARALGIKYVDYAGLSMETVNALNESLTSTVRQFPETLNNLRYVGTAQGRRKVYEESVRKYYEKRLAKLKDISPRYYERELKRSVDSYFRAKHEAFCFQHQEIFDNPDMVGLCVNARRYNEASMEKQHKDLPYQVRIKHWPEGCGTVKSVMDHELGHIIDFTYGVSSDAQFQYNKAHGLPGVGRVTRDNLSGYALTNSKETVAEGWTEYVNNPKPRAWARFIGEIIEKNKKSSEKG